MGLIVAVVRDVPIISIFSMLLFLIAWFNSGNIEVYIPTNNVTAPYAMVQNESIGMVWYTLAGMIISGVHFTIRLISYAATGR